MTKPLISYITENRIEFLKQQHAKGIDTSHDEYAVHREPEKIVDHFAQHADPTPAKQYTQWVVNQYKAKNIRQEDVERINNALTNFHKYKNKLPEKDINKYSSLSEVETAVQPHLGTAASNREREEQEVHSGLKTIHDDGKLKVNQILTKEASQIVYGGGAARGGTGTNWCTAARSSANAFDTYHSPTFPLHTFHIKDDPKSPYQLSDSGQFMDRFDEPAKPEIMKPFTGAVSKIHPIFDFDHEHGESFLLHPNDNVVHRTIKTNPNLPEPFLKGMLRTARSLNTTQAILESPSLKTGLDELADQFYHSGRVFELSHLCTNPNLSSGQLEHIYNRTKDVEGFDSVDGHVAMHPNASPEMLDDIVNNHHTNYIKERALRNPNTSLETIKRALQVPGLRSHAISNPKVTAEMLENYIDDKAVGSSIAKHPNATGDVLEKLRQRTTSFATHDLIAKHPNAHESTIDKMIDEGWRHIQSGAILNSPHINAARIHKILSKEFLRDPRVIQKAFDHPAVTKQIADDVFNKSDDPNTKIGYYISRHASPEQRLEGMTYPYQHIRSQVIALNPHITSGELMNLVKSKDPIAASSALENARSDASHLDAALEHPSPKVRKIVASHDASDESHIKRILQDPDTDVAATALYNPHIATPLLIKIAEDRAKVDPEFSEELKQVRGDYGY